MRPIAFFLALSSLGLTTPLAAQLPVEIHPNPAGLVASDDATLAANKKLVFDFFRTVIEARQSDRAGEFLAENFIEHSPGFPSGRAAFVQRFSGTVPQAVRAAPAELVAIVAEHDFVVLAFRRELLDLEHEGETYTTTWFDLFRVAGGKIIEHWDFGPRD